MQQQQQDVENDIPTLEVEAIEDSPAVAVETSPLRAPKSHVMQERSKDKQQKQCRICLEEDHPEDMIAPCKCKGSSKWVHRACLDQWRTRETDRAFATCTECLFEYHLEAKQISGNGNQTEKSRKRKYRLLVTRDVCASILVTQLFIVIFASFTAFVLDPSRTIPEQINPDHALGVYYACGVGFVLVVLGIVGVCTLGQNNCSPNKAMANYQVRTTYPVDSLESRRRPQQQPQRQQSATDTSGKKLPPQPTYKDRSHFYRQERLRHNPRQHQQQQSRTAGRRNHNNNSTLCHSQWCHDCCVACSYSCHPYSHHGHYYYPATTGSNCCNCVRGGGDCCFCCDACCTNTGARNNVGAVGGNECCGGGDCYCGDCSGGGGTDAGAILCVVFVVVVGTLAILGFFVGIFVVAVLFQRAVQRHIYLLHKGELALEFQVADLSQYDELEQEEDIEASTTDVIGEEEPTYPTAPTLSEQDSSYLKRMGLLT